MTEELEQLKAHLRKNQAMFHQHHPMLGDTEHGFYDADEFDMDKLLAEIDKFGEELRARAGRKP